jgi:hypothetical protein
MTLSEPPHEVQLSFQNGDSETLLVTPMGQNLYRLEESSALGEASYHDVIEGELQADGTVRFIRIYASSGLKTVSWVLSQSLIECPDMTILLGKVMAAGGNWERIFGRRIDIASSSRSTRFAREAIRRTLQQPNSRRLINCLPSPKLGKLAESSL